MTSSLFSFAKYKNVNISKTKKIFRKEKRHFPLLCKAFQKDSNYFLPHRYFKTTHTLKLGELSACLFIFYTITIYRLNIYPLHGYCVTMHVLYTTR